MVVRFLSKWGVGQTLMSDSKVVNCHFVRNVWSRWCIRGVSHFIYQIVDLRFFFSRIIKYQRVRKISFCFQIWACRFQLLMALKLYTLLNDELLPFEELDAPDLYFQYYPTVYIDGRKGIFNNTFITYFHQLAVYWGKHFMMRLFSNDAHRRSLKRSFV